jgi:hypothetical protein
MDYVLPTNYLQSPPNTSGHKIQKPGFVKVTGFLVPSTIRNLEILGETGFISLLFYKYIS